MSWRRGKRRKDSKESEGTEQRPTPAGIQEAHLLQPSAGACGTTADEIPDGYPKNNRHDHRGRYRTRHWEAKKEGFKAPFHGKGGTGQDFTVNKGGTWRKAGTGSQSSPLYGATGPSADKIPSEHVEGQTSNKPTRQGQRRRGGGASTEHRAVPINSGGKPSERNQQRRPGKVAFVKAQHHVRGMFPGEVLSLDIKKLKEVDSTELVRVLNESMPRFKFFLRSQEEEHNNDEFMMDLTCTLANACSAPPSEYRNKILAALKGSVYLSSKIPILLNRFQGSTVLNDQESRERLIQGLITLFMTYLRHLPSSYADLPYDQLKRTLDQSNIDRKEKLQKELQAFKNTRDDIIRAERQKHGKRYINKAGQKPPNDFRDIPVCPTSKEITTQERPFLRKNITKGRYEDAEHYLDVQFRLLREDFLEPLREGIPEIVQNVPRRQRNQLMRYYPGARIVGKIFTPSGITYKVQFDVSRFDTRRWAHSKRLIFGSFLCLSKDNFKTMHFATVCNRDPEELIKGKIDIRFIEEQDIFGIENRNCEYQMVESPAYYEAYRHVLKGLKELDEATLPFKKYLVECSEDVDPPEYLRYDDTQEPVCYDLSLALDVPNAMSACRVPVLESEAWPSVETLPLNDSQLEALKTALTTEFSVIQGPPGTGKTYVGAKIVRCLLENREAWDPAGISPMLMVCYTNHALDQFLEKVLEFLPKKEIIRVGGRCKSRQLEECNLKLFSGQYRMYEKRREVRDMIDIKVWETDQWRKLLAKVDKLPLEFEDLEELLNVEHTEQLYSAIFPHNAVSECRIPSNTFKLWLCNNEKINSCNQHSKKKECQAEKREEILVPPENEGGTDDDVCYDATLLTAPLAIDEGNINNQLVGETGHREVFQTSMPKETSVSEQVSSNTPSNYPNFQKEFNPGRKEFVEKPLEDIIPKGLSGQYRSKLAGSLAFQFSPVVEKAPVSNSRQEECEAGEIIRIEEPENLMETNKEGIEGITDVSEETITVEKEADLIQYQRCIHGDEDFLPVMSKKADDFRGQKQHEEDGINDNDQEQGWELVSYRKKGRKIFPWQQTNVKHPDDGMEKTHVSNVPHADDITQTKSSKKKKKKKKNKNKNSKITITADIESIKTDLEKATPMSNDEAVGVENIWLLSSLDRLRLYLFWVECFRERYRVEIHTGEQEYEQLCHQLEEVRFEEEEEVIRRATVVGMTTSGAARYHSVLQRVAPRIVVIEEAAEVMEAHIITSLSHNTKHTILIGDHKQLRPKATVHELAQKYNLEISLFERMVMNSMDCKRLSIQHRMRPEIAELTKRIYDHEIVDHESVSKFEDITGVTCNLFFIDHCKPEKLEGGLQSFSNSHEADFLVALCNYLLLQGYRRSQITILTMYTGQLLLLQEKMPKRTFGGVRVCAVDNFQGEENDIILLSLVRSNSERRIGFLGESNRICVALSRARQGFYCIGNFSLLKSQCKLWKEICDYLQTKNAIGEILQVVCKKHKNVTGVRSSNDFDIYGGCKMLCGDRLKCGHACDRLCHASEVVHEDSRCGKICFTSCANEHQCQMRCHYPRKCPTCYITVCKTVPQCGHEQSVPCSIDPANFPCRAACERTLICGHDCKKLCGDKCTERCKVQYKKTLPCEHEKLMSCFIDPMVHSQCDRTCTKVLDCGHPCSKRCTDPCQCNTEIEVDLDCGHRKRILCHMKNSPLKCFKRCERELACEHICPGICHEDCRVKKCETLVFKSLPCGHQKRVPCPQDPKTTFCYAPCQRQLNCGHSCSSVCGRQCQEVQCQELCRKKCEKGHTCQKRCHFGSSCGECIEMVNAIIAKCGHSIETPCHVDPATLKCKRPCERDRSCGHPCLEICGKDCENRPCKRLVSRTLPCHHEANLPCHKSPERYACKKRVEVSLSCGHKKSLECDVAKSCEANLLCNEVVEKELCCKHKIELPCHKNPKEYRCKEKVKVTLPCGHVTSVICSVATNNLPDVPCMVKMKRNLPCYHEIVLPCYRKPEEYRCEEEVEVILSCSHKKLVTCAKVRKGLPREPCDTAVTRKLPCGHEKQMKCSDQPEEAFCDFPCERRLSCKHRCLGKCGEDCSSSKCVVKVEKGLACGFHKVRCRCSDDVSQIICANNCKLNLSCGHTCPGKCSENCIKYKCQKPCEKTLDCGHPCPGFCGQDCGSMRCMRRVEKRFSCNHKEPLHCYESIAATCTAPCRRRKSSCRHICTGVCGQDCSKYPCTVAVGKTLSCGHKVKMACSQSADDVDCPAPCKEKLFCGHQCSGTCGDCRQTGSHDMCQHPCSRWLVCSHRCKAKCSEPCPPCDRVCGRRCPHGRCTNRCSQPCKQTTCKRPCTWICPHYQCNSLCGEECERPRCDAPCPKRLPCRHACIGLCGENCPTVCSVCHPKKLSSLLPGGNGTKIEGTRFIQLLDCGHIVKVEEMDAWMLTEPGNDVQLRRCPKCTVPITFSYRYGNIIKRTLANVDNVKTQIREIESEVNKSINLIGKDLARLNYNTRRGLWSIPWTWNPLKFRGTTERRVSLMFTFKNHLMILEQAQRAQPVLENVRRLHEGSQAQLEVGEVLKATKEALREIEEYLEKPQLHLKTLSQVHQQTKKFFLFSHVLEAQSKAMQLRISLSKIGETRLKLAHDRFAAFLQGDDQALELEWLGKIVNYLRTEVKLPYIQTEEAQDFANFPGYQRGVWKICGRGDVYYKTCIVRGGEDVFVGNEGCTQCTAINNE